MDNTGVPQVCRGIASTFLDIVIRFPFHLLLDIETLPYREGGGLANSNFTINWLLGGRKRW